MQKVAGAKLNCMRNFLNFISLLFVFAALPAFANAQWIRQTAGTNAGLRGLSVVNEKVIWASGTEGTVIKTTDGGKSWKVFTVRGAEKLDFRDIEAFDANTAYILSIGNGENSRIYRTADGGETWNLEFKNLNEKAFFDALACWDAGICIAMSDPVDGRFLLRSLTRVPPGGANWNPVIGDMPPAVDGEAAFAASGTCLILQGEFTVFLVSGGNAARVFRSDIRGRSWTVADTPITKGTPGSGIFSIAMFDAKKGVIVGGNYEKPAEHINNLAYTSDGGRTWNPGTGLSGYRSGVTYIDKKTIIAVGTNGSDITRDDGRTWEVFGSENLNSVQAKGKRAVWAVGAKGLVVKMK